MKDHIALVHEALFSHIVNSNLEVRTSVSIDPKTGAAEEGLLFTYEAISRATFLTVDVVLMITGRMVRIGPLGTVSKTGKGHDLPSGPWSSSLDVVRAGFKMIEWLGIGGMGTRGFGRMAIVGEPREETYGGKDAQQDLRKGS